MLDQITRAAARDLQGVQAYVLFGTVASSKRSASGAGQSLAGVRSLSLLPEYGQEVRARRGDAGEASPLR